MYSLSDIFQENKPVVTERGNWKESFKAKAKGEKLRPSKSTQPDRSISLKQTCTLYKEEIGLLSKAL